MSRSSQLRIVDILDRIDAIRSAEAQLEASHRSGDDAGYRIAFDAILYDLVVIGEAVKELPASVTHLRPDVPWSKVARIRDVLAHHYYKVDIEVIQMTLNEPLGILQAACGELVLLTEDDQVD